MQYNGIGLNLPLHRCVRATHVIIPCFFYVHIEGSVSQRVKCKNPQCCRRRFSSVSNVLEDFCGRSCSQAAQGQCTPRYPLYCIPHPACDVGYCVSRHLVHLTRWNSFKWHVHQGQFHRIAMLLDAFCAFSALCRNLSCCCAIVLDISSI